MSTLNPKHIEKLRKEWIETKPQTLEKNRAGEKWQLLADNLGRLFRHHLELWMLYCRTGIGDPAPELQKTLDFVLEAADEVDSLEVSHPHLHVWANADWATSAGFFCIAAGQPQKAHRFLKINENAEEIAESFYESVILKMILGGDAEPLWSRHWNEYAQHKERALMVQSLQTYRALIEACRTNATADIQPLLDQAAKNYLGRKKDSFFDNGPSSACGGPYNDIMVDIVLSAIIKHFHLGPVQGPAAIHEWKW